MNKKKKIKKIISIYFQQRNKRDLKVGAHILL
jgi:hypothetical protein